MTGIGSGAPAPTVGDLIARVNQLVRDVRLDEMSGAVIAGAGRISWSTRSEPKRVKSRAAHDLALQRKTRRDAILRNWQARHPDRAFAERRLRVERANVDERWDHKREGTPATHEAVRRGRTGAIARLYQSGALTDDQIAFAQQIFSVVETIAADVTVRASSLQSRVRAANVDWQPVWSIASKRHPIDFMPSPLLEWVAYSCGGASAPGLRRSTTSAATWRTCFGFFSGTRRLCST